MRFEPTTHIRISEYASRAFGAALFEFSLGIWLVVKGFNPTAVTAPESKDPLN
jgi:hypothetical protein